jgi:two-component system, chemotaxis family, chemotaxis protein CheY
MQILLVGDYGTMRQILRSLLKQLGHEQVEEISDGAQALTRMRYKHFDLVIADWDLQPSGALELLNTMRAEQNLRELPFILATVEGGADAQLAIQQHAFSALLVKPFDLQTLKRKISTVVKTA